MSENQEIEKRLNELTKQVEKLTKYFEQPDELAQDEVIYEEEIRPFDMVQFANFSLSTLSLLDESDTSLSEIGVEAIKNIKRQSLHLLEYGVILYHLDVFGYTKKGETDNNQNN